VNIEEAIHQQWAADEALNAALPVENVVTGLRSGRQVPYATVHRKQNRNVLRSNAGDLDETTVLIHLWHDDYDAGRAIAQKVQAALDRRAFALAGEQRVVRFLRAADSADQHDDGLWQFSIEFRAQVSLPCGD
jgi:hypothetical protein